MEKRSLSKPQDKTPSLKEPRHQSFTELIQQPKAARESTSSPKDRKIMQGDHGTPKR